MHGRPTQIPWTTACGVRTVYYFKTGEQFTMPLFTHLSDHLASQWHPTKNGDIKPDQVSAGSAKKYWWICSKGHEWESAVFHRSEGKKCPYCSGNKVANDTCLATLFPAISTQWHPVKNEHLKPDQVTPGSGRKIWWICSKGHEWSSPVYKRTKGQNCPYCSNKKISKDNNLSVTHPHLAQQFHTRKNKGLTPDMITAGYDKKVWWKCELGHEWQAPVARRKRGSGCPYCTGRFVSRENCLQTLNPKLAKQWHSSKNGTLTPRDVAQYSEKKVWWLCTKGHEYQASIHTRSSGSDCPFCSGKRVSKDNCLVSKNPQLAREWHPTKNGELTPEKVTANSHTLVWWICSKGHEWRISVHGRRKRGCPYCGGRILTMERSLAHVNPELAKEWHPKLNGKLTPHDVFANSAKKVWWKCDKGHIWEASPNNRNKGHGCRKCYQHTVSNAKKRRLKHIQEK